MRGEDPVGRMLKLANELAERAAQGLDEWEESDEEEDAFELATRGGGVRISSVDEDGLAPYRFDILNQQGSVVESFTSYRNPDNENQEAFNELMAKLYYGARRTAYDLDGILDRLFDEFGIE